MVLNSAFVTLFERLEDLSHRPDDVAAFVASAPLIPIVPLPQLTWTLFALMSYRKRKQWAWTVYKERLVPKLRPSDHDQGFLDEEMDLVEGIVPGLPDWAYYVEMTDCGLLHRGTGEQIHLDIQNGPKFIAGMEFFDYINGHRAPGPAERRVAQLFPKGAGLFLALRDLRRAGVFDRNIEFGDKLSDEVMGFSDATEAFLSLWQNADNRLWLSAEVGDWPSAHEAAQATGRRDLIESTGPRTEMCRRLWLKRVRRWVAKKGLDSVMLRALAHAGAEDLHQLLDQVLREGSDAAATAFKIIADDPGWCPQVFSLMVSHMAYDQSNLQEEGANYLARHCHRVDEVIQFLRERFRPRWDVLVELALAYAPDQLRTFLQEALRSTFWSNRLTAVAVLALLDNEWSQAQLLKVLRTSHSASDTSECREALRMSRNEEALRLLDRWEEEHPAEEEEEPLLSSHPFSCLLDPFGLALEKTCELRLLSKMDKLAVLVQNARDRIGLN